MTEIFNAALMMKQDVMQRLRQSPNVVQQGLMVVLLVGVLVGGIDGIREILASFHPEVNFEQLRNEINQAINEQILSAQTLEQREILGIISENVDPAIDMIKNISMLPAALPKPIPGIFRGLGIMASRPLGYLSSLLLAIIFTHIAATWFGGQGTLQQMLGLGALSVAPHALDAIAFIPVLGSLLSLIAWFWGLAVLVVATSVAHKFDINRSVLAVLFFPFIGMLLAFLACCALSLLLVLVARVG